MVQNEQQEASESTLRIATLFIIIVPAIMGLAASSAPEFNGLYASILGCIVGLLFIYSVFQVVTKRYNEEAQRFLHLIIVLNVSALFMLLAVWRVYGEVAWLGVVLLVVYLLALLFAIVKREYLYNAMRHPRKYPVGGRIYGAVLLAAAVIGPSSYGFAVAISSQQGSEVALSVIVSMIVPFAYLFVLVSIPAYVKAEKNQN
ncbi:hypothetical protein [Natribacillus halophilus]|uniref:Uncharacterized protein n=1 Tax=Natribacillus halophilus TaxID=549003 RepID=A0A1G8QBU7_9BACI|nr:hypothetical protein [Natribacillus halophilus]SDJ02033.1 hypothetical protein SAMN04488123_11159 [Natribacillus halophilus]